MKYSKIVADARIAAEAADTSMVVYHNLEMDAYAYTSEKLFKHIAVINPLVRLLLILPNGAIVQ